MATRGSPRDIARNLYKIEAALNRVLGKINDRLADHDSWLTHYESIEAIRTLLLQETYHIEDKS